MDSNYSGSCCSPAAVHVRGTARALGKTNDGPGSRYELHRRGKQ